jgi:hypothetical protein
MMDHLDPFDELAALFLTDPDGAHRTSATSSPAHAAPAAAPRSAPPVSGESTSKAVVELVVVGHLPVRAGLWMTPYADAVARASGPAVLIRLDGEEPTLELLRGDSAAPQQVSAPTASLAHAIESVAPLASTWLIRAAGHTSLANLLDAGADRVTILSSADEAAVVAAYQLVKDLIEAARADANRSLPQLGLAIIGSDDAVAAAMLDRLNRTTATFLGVRLPMVACIRQMDAGIRSSRYMRMAGGPCPAVGEVIQVIAQAQAAASARPPREMPSVQIHRRPTADLPPRMPVADSVDRPFGGTTRAGSGAVPPQAPPSPARRVPLEPASRSPVGQVRGATPIEQLIAAAGGHGNAPPRTTAIKMPPKPAVDLETKAVHVPVQPHDHGMPRSLASFIDGLTLLPVRCPNHERVELAVDAAGRMHVIGREQVLRELPIVQAWARAHRELIAMACPAHRFDPAGTATCHVVSDRPVSLADLHSSDMKLHVLAPVAVGDQTAWYAAALK